MLLFFSPADDKLILYTFTVETVRIVTQSKNNFAIWLTRKESFFSPHVCMDKEPFQTITDHVEVFPFSVWSFVSANFMQLFITITKKENMILKDLKKHLNPMFPTPHPTPRDSFTIIRLIISKQRCCKTNQGYTK